MDRTYLTGEKVLLVFGTLLIIVGIICNEWLLTKWLCLNGNIEYRVKVIIRIVEIILIAIGMGIIVFRKKGLTMNMSIFLITLLILFVGAEIFFRAFLPQEKTGVSDNLFAYDSTLGWQLIPNKTGYFVSKHEFKTKIMINSNGMRDREYPSVKPQGKKRIAVLGDSFTSSFGVTDAETFAKVMEAKLINNTEVLNFGVNGYGPTQELLLLQTRAIKYFPDLVIMIVYVGNDFDDIQGISGWIDGYERPKAMLDKQGQLRMTNIPVPLSKKYFAMKQEHKVCNLPRSHFIDFINQSIRYIRRDKYDIGFMPPELRLCKKNTGPEMTEAFRLMREIIGEADSYCKKNGASFMVAIAPTIVQVYDQIYWEKIIKRYNLNSKDYDLYLPNRVLDDICRKAGIPVIDLTMALKSSVDEGRDTYYFQNQHWNKTGEQVVAETLTHFIVIKKLL
jgi:hypothetical protein